MTAGSARAAGPGAGGSPSLVTPEKTRANGIPSWAASTPSVAGRSPTMARRSPSGTMAARASAVARWGFPATSGVVSAAVATAARRAPAPGHQPVGRRERRVLVRADQPGPLAHRPGRLVHGVEREAVGPAHHHGVGRAFGHHGDAPVGQRLDDPVVAQHQRRRPGLQEPGRDVGRPQEVVVGHADATVLQAAAQLGPRRRRVVRREHHADAGAAQAGHRLVDAGDRASAQPDHPVEIEDPGTSRGRWPHGGRG